MWTCTRWGLASVRLHRHVTPRCNWRRGVASSTVFSSSAEKVTSSHAETVRTGTYGAKGYDFLEGFVSLGPGAALGRLKATLGMYGLIGALMLLSAAYYLTTRRYVLTTNPDPPSGSRFLYYASDYALLENRWTGKRHVITLRDGYDYDAVADDDAMKEKSVVQNDSGNAAIVTKKIYVNWLIFTLRMYLHVTNSTVVVDLGRDFDPYRFVSGCRQTSVKTSDETSNVEMPAANIRLLFHSRLRPIVMQNEYQKGSLPQYEQTVETVARELFLEFYRKAILSNAEPTLNPLFAEELLRNGRLNGKNLSSWTDVVHDTETFVSEIQRRVKERLGDQVILLHLDMTVL